MIAELLLKHRKERNQYPAGNILLSELKKYYLKGNFGNCSAESAVGITNIPALFVYYQSADIVRRDFGIWSLQRTYPIWCISEIATPVVEKL